MRGGESAPLFWDDTPPSKVQLLDELFQRSDAYRHTEEYLDTIRFLARFRSQKPYNAYLLRQQNPQVSFVKTGWQWMRDFGASVRPDARPLVVLVPFGPVAFVYDVTDVDGVDLPPDILDPFPVVGYLPESVWRYMLDNLSSLSIALLHVPLPRTHAGSARHAGPRDAGLAAQQDMFGSARKTPEVRYVVEVNRDHSREQQYTTLAHELAHILCGHLGKLHEKDAWPDRSGLPKAVVELEAESVAYLVCKRAGLESRSEVYLADYFHDAARGLREFSLDTVLQVAGKIESIGERPPRRRADKDAKDTKNTEDAGDE